MARAGMTISDAAHEWVREMNAYPQEMIETLMQTKPEDWHEVTMPRVCDRVYVCNLPDGCEDYDPNGEIENIVGDVYLINLETGINLSAAIQDLINLIGGNGIKSASEGIQLDQIQILSCFYKICGRVETGVIHPLVVDTDGTLQMSKVCNGVFGKYGDSVAVDHIRDTVVDFRVNMVRTTG